MRHWRFTKLSAGFTVLEMMVATSIFAVVLLVLTAGVLAFSRDYFKSVTENNTQEVTRSILNEVAQNIQFGGTISQFGFPGSEQGLCIDDTLYSYQIGQQVAASPANKYQSVYGLIRDTSGDCSGGTLFNFGPPAPTLNPSQHELLGSGMRLSAFSVTPGANSSYTIHIRVIYGDYDLLTPAVSLTGATPNWSSEGCAGTAGSQFCAVSDLTTTVQQRLSQAD